jgi:hypothetical protein
VPFLAAALDNQLRTVLTDGSWRFLVLPPVIIGYIVFIAPLMQRSKDDMLRAIRPMLRIDDEEFARLITHDQTRWWLMAAVSIFVGIFLGWVWTGGTSWRALLDTTSWLVFYLRVSTILIFGVLAYMVYGSIVESRELDRLLNAPLDFDIFEEGAFEPVGRYSLVSALVFLGGILLGIVFGLDFGNITAWRTWLVYAFLGFVVVAIFFSTMYSTHRVMAAARDQEMAAILGRMTELRQTVGRGARDGSIATKSALEFAALSAYEERIRNAPTWPYNQRMLRALAASILLPLLVRVISYIIFGN